MRKVDVFIVAIVTAFLVHTASVVASVSGAAGSPCRIKVIGVGGGGGNVVNRMIQVVNDTEVNQSPQPH